MRVDAPQGSVQERIPVVAFSILTCLLSSLIGIDLIELLIILNQVYSPEKEKRKKKTKLFSES